MHARFDPYRNSFIGRASELQRLQDAFAADAQLVTLVGAPGIGKTRVACRFGQQWIDARPDRPVHFVDMTEILDPVDLSYSVALAVELDASTIDHLGRSLDDYGDCLIILDNFDHLVQYAETTVAQWIQETSRVRFLITSREPLRLGAETTVAVKPLTVPVPGPITLNQLVASEAGRLFLDRANDYTPASDDAEHIGRMQRHLDGVPLSIQMAASRMQVMSPLQMIDRLERGLPLMGGNKDSQSAMLQDAVERSWTLLTAQEQMVLMMCTVFCGGFTLAAAEIVVQLKSHHSSSVVADVLQSLIEKSLIRPNRVESHGKGRLALFESVHNYARQQLRQHGVVHTALVARYSDYYAQMSTEFSTRTIDARGASLSPRIEMELDNMVAACAYSFELAATNGEWDAAHRCATSLLRIVGTRTDPYTHQFVQDALAELLAVMPAVDSNPDGVDAGRLLDTALSGCLGAVFAAFGRTDQARSRQQHAVEVARTITERRHLAQALRRLAAVHTTSGSWDNARQFLAESLTVAREITDSALEIRLLAQAATIPTGIPVVCEALSELSRRVTATSTLNADAGCLIQCQLAAPLQAAGYFDQARNCCQAGEELSRAGGARSRGIALSALAAIEHERRSFEAAAQQYSEALALARNAGAGYDETLTLARLGAVLASQDDVEHAIKVFDAAEQSCRHTGDPALFATISVHRGSLELALSRACCRNGDDDGTVKHRKSALALVDDSTSKTDTQRGHAYGEPHRFALRLLQAEISHNSFLLGRDGAWFQRPDGKRISLAQSKRLRLILGGLIDHYLHSSQTSLALDSLLEIGWPGETMDPRSGANRVHVALTTLRNHGLRDLLTRDKNGYQLDPKKSFIIE